MSEPKPITIEVIAREDEYGSRSRADLVSQALEVDVLRKRFSEFIAGLQQIVDVADDSGPFKLSEIQFSAEIGAEGEFKLLGTGMGVTASSGVTFVLKRT